MTYEIVEQDKYISKYKEKNLNLFWMGFILYKLAYNITTTIIYFNIVYLQALQFVGAVMFIYASLSILKFRIRNSYLRTLFLLYLVWLAGIVARGITFDFFYIK